MKNLQTYILFIRDIYQHIIDHTMLLDNSLYKPLKNKIFSVSLR